MAGPFIFINSFAIKEGKLEELRQFLGEFFRLIEANEPRLLAINAYVNEDGTEVSFVQVHPDAASLEHHQRVTHEHTQRSRQVLGATTSIGLYGKPSDLVLKRTRQHAASGVAVAVNPEHLGGFTRISERPEEPTSRATDRKTEASGMSDPPTGSTTDRPDAP
jgi:hypothetical protein